MISDLMDAMESYAGLNMTLSKTKQRDLECFETYFKFNDIINEFWDSDISRMIGCSIIHYISGGP